MCVDVILAENAKLQAEIKRLREVSPFYPQILRTFKNNEEFIMSSNIRKEWEGRWYSVLLVRRASMLHNWVEADCLARFIAEAYKIILFYKVNGQFEEVCPIQISEEERLNPQK
jgi:hypothetical protein